MATGKALNGKPYAGNPHVRFDEGEVASAATPRRGSLLYVTRKALFLAAAFFTAAVVKGGEMQKTAVCASFDAATIASNGVKVADWMLVAAELRRYALAHVSRVDQIAARLPERPCTPAPRLCDRAAWVPLANDPAAAAIVASAEKLVGAKIDELSDDLYRDFSRTGNRVRYETPYFRKAYRLNLFMVAEALEWKGRFVPEIRRYLESILDEKVWTIPATDTKDIAFVKGQPVICLFSANRAWIVAYAANWFADVLPPELVARAKLECRKRVLDLYLTACRNPSLAKGGGGDPLWWFFARTNWSPVCHAGCVGAALAILDSRRERAECLEAVERAMPHYFQGFGRDGYCSEGMGYWNYGFGHYVALRAMAEQATGGFVTLDSPMAATAAAYAVNFQLENGLSPHFADGGGAPDLSLLDLCHRFWPKVVPSSGVGPLSLNKGDSASFSPCPACAFIALRAFGTASVQQQGGRAKSCCSTLAVSPAPLPMRSVFPQSQVYLMRPGGGKDGITLGVKGGHNAELHNHNDVGSYAISLGGEVLCGDVGGELYSRRTFSSRRYDSEVLNSFGHPVPRPGVLQGLGRRYAARIIRTEFRPNRDTVVFDLTGAYPSKTLKRLHRKFIYDRAAQTVTIRDEVDFKEPTAFDDPLTTLVGVNDKFEFVGKKGRLAVDVETSGGEWEWDVRTMDNGRGELPVTKDAPEGKWAIWVAGKTQNTPPDGRPRRIAVKFKKPVMSAMVEFHFRAVDTNIPEPENVPELMRTFAGEEVKTKEAWEKVRAPELLERFQKDVYGRRPAVLDERKRVSFKVYDERPVMDGKAVRKLVRAEFDGPLEKFLFPFTVYIPKAQKPVPAFVSICLKSRSKVAADHVITSVCWPVEQIVGRGYATIGFLTEDVATEKNTGFAQGVFTCVEKPEVRTDESWGTISAWAWAASRVMDWIETEPAIDATRVGIVGHSRGGKTAIWTGVTDRRFALVCSNNSGAHGAKLNHIRLPKSEDIASIPKYFPNWYCGNYPKKYGGKEMTMDFDQHELLALVAPRLLCVASASEDAWAGQPGEWWSAKLASPAWELYGRRGLVAERFPAPGEKQQEGSISYHLRPGKHSLDPYDWDRYMDFADKNL